MGVKLKYSAASTVAQNGTVERTLATLYNRVYAMLNSGKFSCFLRNDLWAETANNTMLLKNILQNPEI